GEDQNDQRTYDPRHTTAETDILDAFGRVVRKRTVCGRGVLGRVEKPGFLGNELEAVGVAAGVEAAHARDEQGHQQETDEEGLAAGPGRAHACASCCGVVCGGGPGRIPSSPRGNPGGGPGPQSWGP